MSPARVIGMDAGGTKLLGAVVEEGLLVRHRVHRTWRGADRASVLDTMVEAVEEARAAAPDVRAVGFGLPSLIDWRRDESVTSVHLPLDGVRFRDLMSERVGLPVHFDNDVNVAAVAEHRFGAARGADHVVMLTVGTGIGGAVIAGGRLYRGAVGAAGELGHTVVEIDGPPCQGDCPNRGCLEVMASGSAIGREGAAAAEREPDSGLSRAAARGLPITGALVTELAHEGDPAARGVLELIGRRLGVGIANFVNALNPEVVVVGGGAIAGGDLLLDPARAEVAARALAPSRDVVRIVAAHFGEEAGMVGAALLALDEEHDA